MNDINPPEAELTAVKRSGPNLDLNKILLPVAILVAGVLISGSLILTKRTPTQSGNTPQNNQVRVPSDNTGTKVSVSADDDPFLGNKNAKVTVIEFSDFQCPFCRSFWSNTFVQIKKEYVDTGKIRFVYRDFPLSFHPMAQKYAEAGECANEQNKFWEMHDKIFGEQAKQGQGTIQASLVDLKKWAAEVGGLNINKFNQCLDSNKYKVEVEKDVADGTAAGVSGTPTIFVNGRAVVGAQPFSSFKSIIDVELGK